MPTKPYSGELTSYEPTISDDIFNWLREILPGDNLTKQEITDRIRGPVEWLPGPSDVVELADFGQSVRQNYENPTLSGTFDNLVDAGLLALPGSKAGKLVKERLRHGMDLLNNKFFKGPKEVPEETRQKIYRDTDLVYNMYTPPWENVNEKMFLEEIKTPKLDLKVPNLMSNTTMGSSEPMRGYVNPEFFDELEKYFVDRKGTKIRDDLRIEADPSGRLGEGALMGPPGQRNKVKVNYGGLIDPDELPQGLIEADVIEGLPNYDEAKQKMEEVVMHEIQHYIQQNTGMPQGTNPTSAIGQMPQEFKRRFRKYMEAYMQAGVPFDQASKLSASDAGFELYRRTAGEDMARWAEGRYAARHYPDESLIYADYPWEQDYTWKTPPGALLYPYFGNAP